MNYWFKKLNISLKQVRDNSQLDSKERTELANLRSSEVDYDEKFELELDLDDCLFI